MNIFKTLIICIGFSINLSSVASDVEQLPDFKKLVQDQYITPFKNADTDRWLEVFADDALGLHNTLPPILGKDALRQFGEMVATNLNIEQMDIVVDEVRVNGTWALTRGSVTSKFVPKNISDSSGMKASSGKFVLLWEKQADDSWKVILDMGNSNEAPSSKPGTDPN